MNTKFAGKVVVAGFLMGGSVNAILPGLIKTDRVAQIFEQRAAASGKTLDEELLSAS